MNSTTNMDNERCKGIAAELLEIVREHAALAERTTDPLYTQLIELSERWFARWLAVGLMEAAGVSDSGDLVSEMNFAIGDIEAEIIALAGSHGFDAFAQWATGQNVGWEEPHNIRHHPDWPEAPPC